MLSAQLQVEAFLESVQCGILVARNSHGRSLVASGVDLDLMFERVVIEIVCLKMQLARD